MRHGVPGLLCSIAFFAGTCMGLSFAADMDWLIDVALVVAVVLLLAAWVLRALALLALLLVVTAAALLGLVSAGIETTTRPIDAPTGLVDAEPMLVRFEARLLDRFHAPDVARSDLLDRFQPDADQPPWNAPAELLAWHGDQGRVPVRGHVTISAATGPHALMAGDIVTGVGWLSGPAAPMNPGERDLRLSAWQREWVGRLRVDGVPVCVSHAGLLQRSLDAARTFADQGLCASLQGWCDDETRALVVAMTTGRRLPGYAALRQQFAATGLSHFLAISGFNVAVLFVTCGVLMELLCIPGHWRGWMLMLLATLFLLVVDVEVSVLRAGMAGLLAGASIALGRGWRSNGLLATAAIVTLVADPRMAWNTGFQLSYLAVLALRFGSTPIERLLCMPARHVAWPRSERLRRLIRAACTAFAASAAASIASTPVTLAWFGSLNPWCAVASTLLGPLAAALTVVATIAVVLGQLPVIGPMIGCALALLAGCFRLGVNWVGTWPMCSMVVNPLPWWWGVIALIATFAWWLARRRWVLRCSIALLCVTWGSAMMAWRAISVAGHECAPNTFQWTSVAIGDGSVHLIEAGGRVVLFDAGSISRTSAGSTTIVPALRAIGVSRIDAVIVSHPHLDHFAALPEVLDAFAVHRVLLTEPWFRGVGPTSAPQALLDCVRSHGIEPEPVMEGVAFKQGPVIWRCMHPPRGFRPTAVNDGSAAFVLAHDALPDRPIALLLGDAQDQSIARMLARRDILRPWVMELPHHGGWRPLAQALCEWVQPSFVMQSTGARRFRRDRFDACLREVTRGVTCRDGALRFSLDPSNLPPRLEHWTVQGWLPLHPE